MNFILYTVHKNKYTLDDSIQSYVIILFHVVIFRDHFFDTKDRVKENPQRKTWKINKPHEVARGTQPIRANLYKTDESKISRLVKLCQVDDVPDDQVPTAFK